MKKPLTFMKRMVLLVLLASSCLCLSSCSSIGSLLNYLVSLPANILKAVMP